MQEKEEKATGIFPADDVELADVARILAELKDDHIARQAFIKGANTLLLSAMVEHPDISQRLKRAYLNGFERLLRKKAAERS
jgi:hypothetical protein